VPTDSGLAPDGRVGSVALSGVIGSPDGTRRSQRCENAGKLKPVLVGQVEFVEWTPNGHLRPAEVVRETLCGRGALMAERRDAADFPQVPLNRLDIGVIAKCPRGGGAFLTSLGL